VARNHVFDALQAAHVAVEIPHRAKSASYWNILFKLSLSDPPNTALLSILDATMPGELRQGVMQAIAGNASNSETIQALPAYRAWSAGDRRLVLEDCDEQGAAEPNVIEPKQMAMATARRPKCTINYTCTILVALAVLVGCSDLIAMHSQLCVLSMTHAHPT
jgi:hypothetical protein